MGERHQRVKILKCEECEYRFICYTLANNERPQRVKIYWKIQNTCGKCQNVKFGTKAQSYRTVQRPVGFCDITGMLVHKDSATCGEENYKPRKMSQIDKVYKEITEILSLKNKKTKLPKYCVIEDERK